MVTTILPADPHAPRVGSKGEKHANNAYQIKSQMQLHGTKYIAHNPSLAGSKGQNYFFQNNVMLHIKLKEITNAAKWSNYISCITSPTPNPNTGDQKVKIQLFQNIVMLTIK